MYKVHIFSLALTICILTGCSNQLSGIGSNKEQFPTAPFQKNVAPVQLPGDPTSLSSYQTVLLREAEGFTDVFALDRFIKLEEGPTSVVAEMNAMVILGDSLFIADQMRKLIFRFNLAGAFIQLVGKQGNGPGEYGSIANLITDGQHLIVIEGDRGELMYFDREGNFIKTISMRSQGIYNTSYSLMTPDNKLITFEYFSLDLKASFAGIVDMTTIPPKYTHGFIKRFRPMEKRALKGRSTWQVQGYALIGDAIWAGTPYSADIEVHDLQGRKRGTLKPGFKALNYTDFDDINVKNDRELTKLLLSSSKRKSIFPIDNLVLAVYSYPKTGYVCNVYDRNGNLHAKKLKSTYAVNRFLAASDGSVYGEFTTHIEQLEFYQKYLTTNQYQLLESAGWNPNDFFDDNPYVAIWRIKKERSDDI